MRFLYGFARLPLEKISIREQFAVAADSPPILRGLMCVRSMHRKPTGAAPRAISFARSTPMMDVVMIALGLAFFAVTVGYAIACDHL